MAKEQKINLLRTVVIEDNNKEYVSSEYNIVSVCIKVSNLFNIINTVVKDKTLCKSCKNILISTIKEHKNLTNIIRLNNDILSLFDTNIIPSSFNTLSRFINDYNDRNKVFERYYNVYYTKS